LVSDLINNIYLHKLAFDELVINININNRKIIFYDHQSNNLVLK